MVSLSALGHLLGSPIAQSERPKIDTSKDIDVQRFAALEPSSEELYCKGRISESIIDRSLSL